MEGPQCSGAVCIDLSKMKDGDCAGLAAFNSDSGVLTIKKQGKKLTLEMSEQTCSLTEREKAVEHYDEKVIESVNLTSLLSPLKYGSASMPTSVRRLSAGDSCLVLTLPPSTTASTASSGRRLAATTRCSIGKYFTA